jgi:hypothetical protein
MSQRSPGLPRHSAVTQPASLTGPQCPAARVMCLTLDGSRRVPARTGACTVICESELLNQCQRLGRKRPGADRPPNAGTRACAAALVGQDRQPPARIRGLGLAVAKFAGRKPGKKWSFVGRAGGLACLFLILRPGPGGSGGGGGQLERGYNGEAGARREECRPFPPGSPTGMQAAQHPERTGRVVKDVHFDR